MATQIDEVTEKTNEARRAVETQSAVVEGLEQSLAALRGGYSAADRRINAGEGTPEDLDVIGLHPAKIAAQDDALTRARGVLGDLQNVYAQRAARQWVEETLHENPDNLGERAARVKADGAARMAEIHREVTEQLAELEQERAGLERTALALSRAIEDHPTLTSARAGLELMYGSRAIVGLDGSRMYLDGDIRDLRYGELTGAQMDQDHRDIGRDLTPPSLPGWLTSLGQQDRMWG